MSKSIDQRVVEMKFDNKHFESNVSTTMSTLEKLKQSLNLKGASKGLENVGAAAKNCDMSGLNSAIQTVQTRFSALQVVGVTALANITNSAINAGKRIVSALTIDPVKTGFQEYELKMGSIQTIMASTGESLSSVNGYLNELNQYSDKTIYSFSDMTTNIGKFTNAGVKLNDAVLAIKGISNEAAVSGANANEASRAMYNFAQALSAGHVKLMDWKSIELANMATVEFKEHLLDAAVATGTLTKSADGMYRTLKGDVLSSTKNFNETLEQQWLTTDVLISTLKEYSDETTDIGKKAYAAAQDVKTATQLFDTLKESAQSGWAETWEIIVGDFDEAKSLFTYLSKVFGEIIDKSSDARNEFLKGALSTSPWEKLSETISKTGVSVGDFQNALIETAKAHGVAADEIIKEAGSFEKSLSKGWLKAEIIVETLDRFADGASNTTDKLEDLHGIIQKVLMGDFGNGADRVKALTDAGYDYAVVQDLVNKTIYGEAIELENLSDAQLKSIGYTDEQISALRDLAAQAKETGTPLNELIKDMSTPSGRDFLFMALKNVLEEISKIIGTIKDAWDKVFGDFFTSEDLAGLIGTFYDFTENIKISDEALKNLSITVEGFFRVLELAAMFTSGTFAIINKIFKGILNILQLDFLGFTARIGQMIIDFRNWILVNNDLVKSLTAAGDRILDFLVNTGNNIRTWVSEFMALEIVQNVIEEFKNAFVSTWSKLKEWFGGIGKLFSEFIGNVQAMDSFSFEGLTSLVKDLVGKIFEQFGKIGDVFNDLTNTVVKFKDLIFQNFGSVGDSVSDLWTKMYDFFKFLKDTLKENFGFAEIFTVIAGSAIIIGAMKLLKIISALTKTFLTFAQGWDKIVGSITSAIDSFGKARLIEAKSVAIRNIAISIALIAGSLWVLAQLDTEQIIKALISMTVIVGLLAGLAFALGKIGKMSVSINVGASAIFMMAAALGVFVLALKLMEGMDSGKALANAGILGLVAVGLAAVVGVLGKCAPKLSAGSFTLLAFSGSLLILVQAIKSLGDIDIPKAYESVKLLITLMLSLGVLSAVCKGLKFGSAVGLLAIVISLKLLISVINDIAGLDLGKIKSNLGAFITVFGMIALLLVATKFAGENAAKAGVAMIAISVSLMLIVAAIKMLSGLSKADLSKASGAVAMLMLVFGAVVALSNFAGRYAIRAGVMLLAMSGAMVILAGAIAIVSHIKPDGLKRAIVAIELLGVMFAGLIVATKWANISKDTVAALTVMTVAIGMMVVAIGALSMLEPAKLASSVAALSVVMLSFGVLVVSTKLAEKATGTLVTMIVVVGLLAGILAMLSLLPVESTLGNAAGLALLLLSLSASMAIISKTGTIAPTAYASIGAMVLVVAGLAAIIGVLASMEVGSTLEIAASLSVLLLSLSAACLILSAVGATGPASLIGIGALAVLIVGVGALMVAIGALATYFPEMEEFLNRGLPLLESIGYGLGSFFGNIAGGFISGMTDGLTDIGDNLSAFMDSIQPFLAGASSISPDSVVGVKILAETILILTAANLMESVGKFLTGGSSLSDFASQLVPFGTAMKEYSEAISGLDSEIVINSANAGKALAEMATTLPNSGGVAGFFAGENDMGEFANQLVPFGKAMKEYSDAVAGIDASVVENSAMAGKALAEMATTLPNSGGVAGFFAGENDMSIIAEQLVPFGKAMKEYSDAVTGIDTEIVENSARAGKAMAEMATTLPNSGGAAGFFAGENDMSIIAEQLVPFGKAMKEYSDAIAGMNPDIVANSANAAKSVVELQSTLPESGGWFSSNQTLESFGQDMAKFGTQFASYYDSVSGVNVSVLSGVITQTSLLVDMLKGMSGVDFSGANSFAQSLTSLGEASVDGFISAFTNANSRVSTAVSTMMSTFVNTANSYSGQISSVFDSLVTSVLSSINSKQGSFNIAGVMLMIQFSVGVASYRSNIVSMYSSIMTEILSMIMSNGQAFNASGTMLMNAFATGVSTGSSTILSSISSTLNGCVATMHGYYGSFYSAGKYLVQGFANGITAETWRAAAEAKAMANAAETAAKRALDERSPSKVFEKIGEFVAMGLANGISAMAHVATRSTDDMAKTTIDGAKNAMSKIGDALSTDVESKPTIRPVLDMTNVNSRNSEIQLNANVNTLLTKPIDSLSQLMADAQNEINASNREVISAINGLREDINTLYSSDDKEIALYVDSKKLSSSLVKPMNRQLNIISNQGGGL